MRLKKLLAARDFFLLEAVAFKLADVYGWFDLVEAKFQKMHLDFGESTMIGY